MHDEDCVRFLKDCLPRLELRWAGFRRVHRTVCKRIGRRLRALDLPDLAAYRRRLEADPTEWARLDALCRIPVSRFYRDRRVFDALRDDVLPALAGAASARAGRLVRAWCAGCASGEEVYTLRLIWDLSLAPRHPALRFTILGTDADEVLLARAADACYGRGSFREAPRAWLDRAFEVRHGRLCLRSEFKRDVAFRRQDIRTIQPAGPFDLVLCRNLVMTYFAPALQERLLPAILARLRPGGVLIMGAGERLPAGGPCLVPLGDRLPIFRRPSRRAAGRAPGRA